VSILDQPLGRLARDIPGITAVFNKYRLDFCCGGKQTLRRAAARRDLDTDALQAELDALQRPNPEGQRWEDAPDARLIDHIRTRYHAVHREQLPELIRLARRVEQVHGDRPDCPVGLASHLEHMHAELESHMQKEEQILFPLIEQGRREVAVHPAAAMRGEHDGHGEALAGIDRLTGNITPPPDACNTWRALYLGLDALKTDLMNHIHLENNILFDRIDGYIGGADNG
jgi:regulator of cell morphogenesis and NO signaling